MSRVVYRLPTSLYGSWPADVRDQLHAWLTANGIDHTRVPVSSDVTIDITVDDDGGQWVETWQHVRTDAGKLAPCPSCPACPAMGRVRVPLQTSAPIAIPGEWHPDHDPQEPR